MGVELDVESSPSRLPTMNRARLIVVALALTACRTIVVQEGAIITPVPDRPLTAAAVTAQLPGYSFEEHAIIAAD